MKITRREFLKRTAALAAVGLLPDQRLHATPAKAHRIVRVHNPLASFFDVVDFQFQNSVPETYYGNFVNQQIVYEMFDTALCALTGDDEPTKAMRRLVPYKAGERVFIKINMTTSCISVWRGRWDRINWDAHYNDTDAIAEPINATIRALVRIGVPQEMIGICDPSRTEGRPNPEKRTPRLTPNRVARKIKAAFPSVMLYCSSFVADGDGITWKSNDRHVIVKFRDPVIDRRKERVTSHRLPDQVIAAEHFINLPIMKRHGGAGVTGALKNNFGTIASCRYFHEPLYAGQGKKGATYSSDANPAVDIWLNPHIGKKTRLIVCDGIFGGWDWGKNPPTRWKCFRGRSPNCLLLGTDPAAMDSVIFDHVTESLPEKVKDYPEANMLVDAARVGLGRHESRKGPKAPYKTIDYMEMDRNLDEAKLRKLEELRKKYKAGRKTRKETEDLLGECRAML
ncbi:DUF362 domain-containing protein [bacterium]|nr:DUF362 domain-containing protein [bacterium]